jgi:hypothetical protein
MAPGATGAVSVIEWEYHILEKISDLGGSACLKQIYDVIEHDRSFRLSADQRRRTAYGNRPAYQHQVRSHLSNLLPKDEVIRIKRGCYQMTEKGQARI